MKYIYTILAIMVLAFGMAGVSGTADAQEYQQADGHVYALVGGFSKHFKDRSGGRDFNEVNNNLGLELEHHIKNGYFLGATASYIRNSLDYDSALIAATAKKKWQLNPDWNVGVGFAVGAQNGYPNVSEDRDRSDFVAVAYPLAEVNYKRVGAYVTCVPNLEGFESGFCFIGGKLRLFDY